MQQRLRGLEGIKAQGILVLETAGGGNVKQGQRMGRCGAMVRDMRPETAKEDSALGYSPVDCGLRSFT